MTTIHEIEKAVSRLPHEDFRKFRAWFEEFDARQWDEQFEHNVAAGKLNVVAEEAIAEYRKGNCKPL